MVTGTRPKPGPGGAVGNLTTGARARPQAALRRRLRARRSGIGAFLNACVPDARCAHSQRLRIEDP